MSELIPTMKNNESPKDTVPGIGCVVMAAGASLRFGGNKLLAPLDGKALVERVLDALLSARFKKIAVVTRYEEVRAIAAARGFDCLINDRPELGLSHTVRLGTSALMESCRAIMYLVADQPGLTRHSVEGLIALSRENPDRITALSHEGRRGNPVIFPRRFFPELLSLKGDEGGSHVIRAHEEALLLFEAAAGELIDVDTREDLTLFSSSRKASP